MNNSNENRMSRFVIFLIVFSFVLVVTLITIMLTLAMNRNDDSSNGLVENNSSQIENTEKNTESNNELNNNIDNSSDDNSVSSNDSENIDVSTDDNNNPVIDNEFHHGWYVNKFGYTYLYGDAGYVQFTYGTEALNKYINSINELTELIPSDTEIYNIIAPVGSTFVEIPSDICRDDNFYNKSQGDFVSTVATLTDKSIKNISIVPVIREAYDAGGYMFLRTDNNWTSSSAYIAYSAFCEQNSISAYPLSYFKEIHAGDYLGRFYFATEEPYSMKYNPDDVICYGPPATIETSLTVYDNGIVSENYSLCDNEYDIYNLYNNFYLGKSAGRYEINTTVSGGNLLIIGDSSAYSMIPFLSAHYSKIDFIDPQFFNGSLEEFLEHRQYSDVLNICYSTNAIIGEYVPAFNSLTGGTVDGQ